MTHGEGTEGGKDVFTEVAADGSATGPAVDLAHLFDPAANWLGASDPYAYLAKLADLMGEAHKVKRAELTWLHWRCAREYSALKVRLAEGFTFHRHSAARELWVNDPNRKPRGEVMPYHCARPAWLRPSGWYCRECGELLTDESAEFRLV